MSAPESQAAPALAAGAMLGEGPVWDERQQELFFVDIMSERVHRFRPAYG